MRRNEPRAPGWEACYVLCRPHKWIFLLALNTVFSHLGRDATAKSRSRMPSLTKPSVPCYLGPGGWVHLRACWFIFCWAFCSWKHTYHFTKEYNSFVNWAFSAIIPSSTMTFCIAVKSNQGHLLDERFLFRHVSFSLIPSVLDLLNKLRIRPALLLLVDIWSQDWPNTENDQPY